MRLSEQSEFVRDFVNEFGCVAVPQMTTLLHKAYGLNRDEANYLIRTLYRKKIIYIDDSRQYILPGDRFTEKEIKVNTVTKLWIPIILAETKVDCLSIRPMKMRAGDVLFVAENKTCQLVLADPDNLTETKELLAQAEREKKRISQYKNEDVQATIPRVYVLFPNSVTKERAQYIAESFQFDAFYTVCRVANENIAETFKYSVLKQF